MTRTKGNIIKLIGIIQMYEAPVADASPSTPDGVKALTEMFYALKGRAKGVSYGGCFTLPTHCSDLDFSGKKMQFTFEVK